MEDEFRYAAALSAGLAILEALDANPAMPRHERLATAIFTTLRAIAQVEARLAAQPGCPACLRYTVQANERFSH
jgi:hypothetical protein